MSRPLSHRPKNGRSAGRLAKNISVKTITKKTAAQISPVFMPGDSERRTATGAIATVGCIDCGGIGWGGIVR